MPNHDPEHYPPKEKMPIFGDLTQSEKRSEIKPPLLKVIAKHHCHFLSHIGKDHLLVFLKTI